MKIKRAVCPDGSPDRLMFRCPGCDDVHAPSTAWAFNGDYERPTLTPSILVTYSGVDDAGQPVESRCHSYVRDGRIEFLTDCSHALAGQTVELPDWAE